MVFKKSPAIDNFMCQIEDDLLDRYDHLIDGTCTTGYDNDGSTGLEIFANGVVLGSQARDQPIYVYHFKEDSIAIFFIGEEDKILQKLKTEIGCEQP